MLIAEGRLDDAIDLLTQLLVTSPHHPDVLTDLGMAYEARFDVAGLPVDLVRALDATRHAAQADATLSAARFNLAVLLNRLNLRWSARIHEAVYLDADPRSPWAAELLTRRLKVPEDAQVVWRRRRDDCTAAAASGADSVLEACVAAFPSLARDELDRLVLEDWTSAMQHHDRAAANRVAVSAERWANALSREKPDSEPSAIVASMRRPACGGRESLTATGTCESRLASGLETYRRGLRLYQQAEPARALPLLEAAVRALSDTTSPYVLWATFYATAAVANGGDASSSVRYAEVVQAARARGFRKLLGQALWGWAIRSANLGDTSVALRRYVEASEIFSAAREPENQMSASSLVAKTLRELGNRFDAWPFALTSLRLLPEAALVRQERALLETAALAGAEALNWAQLAIAEELIEVARRRNVPVGLTTAYFTLADSYRELGMTAPAAGALDAAAKAIPAIEDPYFRLLQESRLHTASARLAEETDPERTVALLSKTIDTYDRIGLVNSLPDLLLARGDAYRSLDASREAERDFDRGIELFERIRDRVRSGSLRVSYVDRGWQLYGRKLGLLLDRGHRGTDAFAVAERSRADEVFRRTSPQIAARTTLDELARTLPRDHALLHYTVLTDRVALWVVRDGLARLTEIHVTADTLERDVTATIRALTHGNATEAVERLSELHDLLLKPAMASRHGIRTLLIAADGILHRVPFGALRSRENGRYLIEDTSVAFVPNATLSLGLAMDSSPRSRTPLRILALGNPAVADGAGRGLTALPAAEAESREVAAMYAEQRFGVGAAATRSWFVKTLPDVDVAHVAAHAIASVEQPGLSRLLLAPDLVAGAVTAADIQGLDVSRLRLMVLAACATADGAVVHGEGVLGLSHAFLAAGVPAIVATQRDIDDRVSRRLFVELHRHWRAGASVAEALRLAQLALLRSGDTGLTGPSAWSPVIAMVRSGPPHR